MNLQRGKGGGFRLEIIYSLFSFRLEIIIYSVFYFFRVNELWLNSFSSFSSICFRHLKPKLNHNRIENYFGFSSQLIFFSRFDFFDFFIQSIFRVFLLILA